jgi:hypothetical protein
MRNIFIAGFALLFIPVICAQNLPWVFPGDFRERMRISDLVISGVIEQSSEAGAEFVDRTELVANIAQVRIDRVFQGHCSRQLQFKWFRLWSPAGEGMLYSGPPVSNFRTQQRYLIFLKRADEAWVVSMPVYALEMTLAANPSANRITDLSGAPLVAKYQALAQELEIAAMAVPDPPPGVTGDAATYFSSVFDLIGGCAGAFYYHFESSPSPELRRAALEWAGVIKKHHAGCAQAPSVVP